MKTNQILAAVVAVVGTVSAASADMVMYTDTFGPNAVSSSTSAALSQFDPALGTLTQVTLMLEATTDSGSIAWDNEAPVASDITLGIGAEVTATAPGSLTAVAIPLQTGSTTVDADNEGAADFLGSDAFSLTGGSGTDSDSDASTDAATLALFTGLGNINVQITSGVETFLSTSGGFGPIDPTPGMYSGTVKVIYEYTPVPAPAGAGLLVLAGLAASRRRR